MPTLKAGALHGLAPNTVPPVVQVYVVAADSVYKRRILGASAGDRPQALDDMRCNGNVPPLAVLRLTEDGRAVDIDRGRATDLDAARIEIDVAHLERDNFADAESGVRHELDSHGVGGPAGR